MSVNPLLLPLLKDKETIRQEVLSNIVTMLKKRKWIFDENADAKAEELKKTINDDHIYTITLDVRLSELQTYYPTDIHTDRQFDEEFNKNDNKIVIKLLHQNINNLKFPAINDFLNYYKNSHKILVVSDISEKIKNRILTQHTEIFTEPFLMIKLADVDSSPQYDILTPNEIKELLDSYDFVKKHMNIMLLSDPMSKYLFLQSKQVVRIIRDSQSSGKSIGYRIIV